MAPKKRTKMNVLLFRNANVVVLLWRIGHRFNVGLTWLRKICPNTMKACFASFNSSQLFDKKPLVRPFESCLGPTMLKLPLDRKFKLRSNTEQTYSLALLNTNLSFHIGE